MGTQGIETRRLLNGLRCPERALPATAEKRPAPSARWRSLGSGVGQTSGHRRCWVLRAPVVLCAWGSTP